jgi:hypothetical protein
MAQFKVEVDNDVYTGSFYGESVEVKELNDEASVLVHEADGGYTAHRAVYVESIELTE